LRLNRFEPDDDEESNGDLFLGDDFDYLARYVSQLDCLAGIDVSVSIQSS
jgi:hypothetical protein